MCFKAFFRIFPKRYFLAFLSFIVVLLQISMRTIFTMTLVFLNSTSSINCTDDNETVIVGNETKDCHCVVKEEERIHWDAVIYSQTLSAYFYGYVVTQIPGGILSQRYPAYKVFGISCFISFALFLIIPFVIHSSWEAVVAIRVLQGLVEGVSLPAMNGVLTHWARSSEKTRLVTIMSSGAYLSAALGLGVTGAMICKFGWPIAFYFFSAVGMFFSIYWLIVIRETPMEDPTIGTLEKHNFMISRTSKNVIAGAQQATSVPWRSIFLSLPISAIFVASFCRCWVFFLLLTEQPQYFRDVFHYNIEQNGALSTMPHICMTIVVLFGGMAADGMISRGISKTIVRKLFNSVGFGLEAAAMYGLSLIPSTLPATATAVLSLGVGISGLAISGYQVNPHDLAPDRASILSGVAKLGSIAGIIMPYIVSSITGSHPGFAEWSKVFRISALLHFCGVVYYAIFASGKIQPWSQSYQQTTVNAERGAAGNYGTIEEEKSLPGPILETCDEYEERPHWSDRARLLRETPNFDQPYWYRSVNVGE